MMSARLRLEIAEKLNELLVDPEENRVRRDQPQDDQDQPPGGQNRPRLRADVHERRSYGDGNEDDRATSH